MLELLVIVISCIVGILGLFSKTKKREDSEVLTPVGWCSAIMLIGGCLCASWLSLQKERTLDEEKEKSSHFSAEVEHLESELSRSTRETQQFRASVAKLTIERDKFKEQIDELNRNIRPLNEIAVADKRVDADVSDEEWHNGSICLKLTDSDLGGGVQVRVTKEFSGHLFAHSKPVLSVQLVNIQPQDINRIIFASVTLHGYVGIPRSTKFGNGDRVVVDASEDDGDYWLEIESVTLRDFQTVLARNPNAGVRLTIS